jgi:hypothetical protein
MKTSDLTGAALDWAVAKAKSHLAANTVTVFDFSDYCFNPSTDWAQGGPIIERERIKVAPNLNGTWHGQIRHTKAHPLVAHPVLAGWTNKHGPTPLIAAMRCYVASKLGDEVDVPPELSN